jgi:hypothetical protein
MKKSRVAQFISIILKLMFFLGIIGIIFIPKLYNTFSDIQGINFEEQSNYYKIAFYMCAIGGLCILYELIRIFNDVYKGSPFKRAIEVGLKKIAVLFMLLSLIVGIKIIFIPTVLSAAVSLITFIASLSFYVLSQIFKVAIEYKNEIDFTV